MPLGKARAIARAWISWVNSNFIFSFPDGSSHQTRRCAPLPSRRTRRPLHLRLHRHPLSAATIATIANAVSAPPSSPSLSSSLPHHRHPHRPPRRRHLLAARPMLPPGKVPLPPSPSPPPPSPTPYPPFTPLCACSPPSPLALPLSPSPSASPPPPSHHHPCRHHHLIPPRNAKRTRCACVPSPHACTHPLARPLYAQQPPALPGPHLAQHSPSFASLSGRSQCELSNEVR